MHFLSLRGRSRHTSTNCPNWLIGNHSRPESLNTTCLNNCIQLAKNHQVSHSRLTLGKRLPYTQNGE